MDRKVQLYVTAYKRTERLELFNDEQISITSTVQNIQDISKNYTDFSQSFTIPASDYNNSLLQHFYQSDVDSFIDYNRRLDAYIEIDLSLFRRGKLQIEKSNLKNGQPYSYTVTFYGLGTTLKDLIGEDLLSDLDYSNYNHLYSGAEVRNRVTNSTNLYDVKYPLITSNRIWGYQSQTVNASTPDWLSLGGGANNIHSSGGAIVYTELFPALRVSKILDLIQDKYGITFNGSFLLDDRFTKLFLLYKNSNNLNRIGEAYTVDFSSIFLNLTLTVDLSTSVDLLTNSIKPAYVAGIANFPHAIKLEVLSVSNSDVYYIDTYQNGNLISTLQSTGTGQKPILSVPNTYGINDTYTFKIRFTTTTTMTSRMIYNFVASEIIVDNSSISAVINLNLEANAPKMKVVDFFSGILKTFNLTCVGTSDTAFSLAPVDDWYGQGRIIDITKHTQIDSIDVARMPLYKKIGYKFQDSECFLNKQFTQTYNRGYGDMSYQYDYDGGEFTTELPFENLLQQTFTGTRLQVGYCLNNEFAPYVPKPVLLYQYTNEPCDFKFDNGSSVTTITSYTPFGQDLRYNNQDFTLNFAPETSTLLQTWIQNTLFYVYSFSYIYGLYNNKQRLISLKAKLPTSILTSLKLNDRLIIRDKRYIINEMKPNLTSGDVDFSLYLDFRPMINRSFYISPSIGGDVKFSINLPNNSISADLFRSSETFDLSTYSVTDDTIVVATIPASTVGDLYVVNVVYNYSNGTQTFEDINIQVQ